ncbi:hypothetical protein J2T56_000992 [Natronobacillus azotifigens]|uniref:Uncharacterized protein n=1 Tax=Natronobacillus azotifigens TaxID=472978 RepID=A0A9J6RA19_9BACI|nr:hypothetical protein [Natronobacillus azotifigens]MCZ0702429.1 hypothetical protein [Natronobacillus azotifigens]
MEEKRKKAFYRRWWFWVIIAIIVIGMAASGEEDVVQEATPDTGDTIEEDNEDVSGVEDQDEAIDEEIIEDADETEADATDDSAKPDPIDRMTYGSGMYEVGTDIQPGLYRSEGSVNYWARLSGFSGEFDEIIANGNPMGASHVVEIFDHDVAFESSGSGEWYLIDDNYEGELATEFGDGIYIVGVDIEPGRYRSEGGSGSYGYWARLSGFSGGFDDIIANGNPEGSTIVEIDGADQGFETSGNGTWTKVE